MKSFASNFADRIMAFLREKQAIGLVYNAGSDVLHQFDKFCLNHYPSTIYLSQELVLNWAIQRKTESANAFRLRLQPIREFARYLIRRGEKAYVIPTMFAPKTTRYTPYIFTNSELNALFVSTDNIPSKESNRLLGISLSTMFRLIYCCGLRPKEARMLQTDDIDFENELIYIKESKGHKDRLLPVSPDVLMLCKKYDSLVHAQIGERPFFFSDSNKQPYTKDSLKYYFRKIWNGTNLQSQRGTRPRLYDLRHTFATNQLMQWSNKNCDINVYLSYLSTYLGHAQLSCTAYYIHLCPELLSSEILNKFNMHQFLLPEVSYDE